MNAERSGLCDRAFKPAFFDLLVDKNRCRSRSAKSARYGVIMKILHMFVGRHMGGDGRQYLGFAPFLSFRHVQFLDRGLQALKIALAKDEKLGDLGILHAQASDVTLVRGGGLNDPTPGAFEPVTFELNIEDPDYVEHWPDEIEIYHNPNAAVLLPEEVFAGTTQFFLEDGELVWRGPSPRVLYSSTMSRAPKQ
ncbi:MAG: hypothetical protein J0H42_20570 [Rhizobiales bacterium]|nr:hypothetical protein [Hyphomicrobiales bacterium]